MARTYKTEYPESLVIKIIEEIRKTNKSVETIRANGMLPTTFYERARRIGFSLRENKVNPKPKTGRKKYSDAFIMNVTNEINGGAASYETFRKYNLEPSTYYYRIRKLRTS